jgi:hypothetical protein
MFFLAAMPTPAAGDSDSDRLIAESLKPSPLEDNLRRLTDDIGGRVPGTRGMTRAIQWATESLRAAGADTVHTEEFTMPLSWAEGATQVSFAWPGPGNRATQGAMPMAQFRARAVSIAWAPALVSTAHVPVIDIGEGTAADFQKAGDFSGKLLLVHSKVAKTWEDLFSEYLEAPPIIQAAVKGHAKAIAFTSTREHDLLYRHTNSTSGELEQVPMVLLAREDAERVARLLAAGRPVWADLSIPNKVGGSIETANVVAEIKGSEKPDEFVVLGAHLDSWELGTGALDNG